MILLDVFLAIVLVFLGAALWQHFRYLKLRRGRIDDRQPLFYPARSFHAVTYLKVAAGRSVLDELRALREIIESPGGGSVVYAGLVGPAMAKSKQLANEWDGLILAQYPSREAFDAMTARDAYRELLARSERTHTHGAIRKAGLNLMVPLGLLLLRLWDILLRKPSAFPFQPVGEDGMPGLKAVMKDVEQLDAFREIKDDAHPAAREPDGQGPGRSAGRTENGGTNGRCGDHLHGHRQVHVAHGEARPAPQPYQGLTHPAQDLRECPEGSGGTQGLRRATGRSSWRWGAPGPVT